MDAARRLAVIVTVLAQAFIPVLSYTGIDPSFRTSVAQSSQTPVVPAEYAFTIWGAIFAAAFAYAIWQALPTNARHPLARATGWPLSIAYASNALWIFVATRNGSLFLLVMLLCAIAAGALLAHRAFQDGEMRTRIEWCSVGVPTGLLAGWATFAVFANLSVALKDAGLGAVPGSTTIQAVLLILSAVALAGAIALRFRSSLFLFPVAWALIGIMVRNTLTTPNLTVAGVAGASLAAALLVRLGWSRIGKVQG